MDLPANRVRRAVVAIAIAAALWSGWVALRHVLLERAYPRDGQNTLNSDAEGLFPLGAIKACSEEATRRGVYGVVFARWSYWFRFGPSIDLVASNNVRGDLLDCVRRALDDVAWGPKPVSEESIHAVQWKNITLGDPAPLPIEDARLEREWIASIRSGRRLSMPLPPDVSVDAKGCLRTTDFYEVAHGLSLWLADAFNETGLATWVHARSNRWLYPVRIRRAGGLWIAVDADLYDDESSEPDYRLRVCARVLDPLADSVAAIAGDAFGGLTRPDRVPIGTRFLAEFLVDPAGRLQGEPAFCSEGLAGPEDQRRVAEEMRRRIAAAEFGASSSVRRVQVEVLPTLDVSVVVPAEPHVIGAQGSPVSKCIDSLKQSCLRPPSFGPVSGAPENLEKCFEPFLSAADDHAVAARVGPSGQVTGVDSPDGRFSDETLECATRALQALRFEPSPGGPCRWFVDVGELMDLEERSRSAASRPRDDFAMARAAAHPVLVARLAGEAAIPDVAAVPDLASCEPLGDRAVCMMQFEDLGLEPGAIEPDGTLTLLSDAMPGRESSQEYPLTPAGGRLYFRGRAAGFGPVNSARVGVTDGTPSGTRWLFLPGASEVWDLAPSGGRVLVALEVAGAPGRARIALVSPQGEVRPIPLPPYAYGALALGAGGGEERLTFFAELGEAPSQLWARDVATGTSRWLGEFASGAFSTSASREGTLLFAETFGVDHRLWASDGTLAGTRRLRELGREECDPDERGTWVMLRGHGRFSPFAEAGTPVFLYASAGRYRWPDSPGAEYPSVVVRGERLWVLQPQGQSKGPGRLFTADPRSRGLQPVSAAGADSPANRVLALTAMDEGERVLLVSNDASWLYTNPKLAPVRVETPAVATSKVVRAKRVGSRVFVQADDTLYEIAPDTLAVRTLSASARVSATALRARAATSVVVREGSELYFFASPDSGGYSLWHATRERATRIPAFDGGSAGEVRFQAPEASVADRSRIVFWEGESLSRSGPGSRLWSADGDGRVATRLPIGPAFNVIGAAPFVVAEVARGDKAEHWLSDGSAAGTRRVDWSREVDSRSTATGRWEISWTGKGSLPSRVCSRKLDGEAPVTCSPQWPRAEQEWFDWHGRRHAVDGIGTRGRLPSIFGIGLSDREPPPPVARMYSLTDGARLSLVSEADCDLGFSGWTGTGRRAMAAGEYAYLWCMSGGGEKHELMATKWNSQRWRPLMGFRAPRLTPMLGVGGRLVFFAAAEHTAIVEAWASEGTPETTRRLAEGVAVDVEVSPVVWHAEVIFVAVDLTGANAPVIWRTNGTPQGTRPLELDSSAERIEGIANLAVVGDALFFTGFAGGGGRALWRMELQTH